MARCVTLQKACHCESAPAKSCRQSCIVQLTCGNFHLWCWSASQRYGGVVIVVVAAEQLLSIVERIERLNEEIKSLNDDKRDIYAEAKSNGFDVKAVKVLVAERAKDPSTVKESNQILDTYRTAIEQAVLNRVSGGRARREAEMAA